MTAELRWLAATIALALVGGGFGVAIVALADPPLLVSGVIGIASACLGAASSFALRSRSESGPR